MKKSIDRSSSRVPGNNFIGRYFSNEQEIITKGEQRDYKNSQSVGIKFIRLS